MYSGITQGLCPVVDVMTTADLMRYRVRFTAPLLKNLQCGASVNIDGVCQTVVAIDQDEVSFEAISETLKITTLGELTTTCQVSVERSLKVGDEIGGHEIAGHVIGMAQIIERHMRDGQLSLRLACPKAWMPYIIHKGSIAVNGSSLTVSDPKICGEFAIHLIPETLRLTAFASKRVGDRVNIELDHRTRIIVDTVKQCQAL